MRLCDICLLAGRGRDGGGALEFMECMGPVGGRGEEGDADHD